MPGPSTQQRAKLLWFRFRVAIYFALKLKLALRLSYIYIILDRISNINILSFGFCWEQFRQQNVGVWIFRLWIRMILFGPLNRSHAGHLLSTHYRARSFNALGSGPDRKPRPMSHLTSSTWTGVKKKPFISIYTPSVNFLRAPGMEHQWLSWRHPNLARSLTSIPKKILWGVLFLKGHLISLSGPVVFESHAILYILLSLFKQVLLLVLCYLPSMAAMAPNLTSCVQVFSTNGRPHFNLKA